MKILVIEDELSLQSQLVKQISAEGYSVSATDNAEEGLYLIEEYKFDLAIVDIGLPGMSGVELVEQLRTNGASNNKMPVIMLTARSSWKDKVTGLKAGADDYLAKPFQVEELLARIEAMLRRSGSYVKEEIIRGPYKIDLSTEEVFVNSESIKLTAYEYKLLNYFMRQPMKVVSKSLLMDYLYEEDIDRDPNVLEVLIARLRRKLDPDSVYKPLETLRGRGYRFVIKD